MATVLSQLLDRLEVVLAANAPNGTLVWVDRVDPESREELPSIVVLAKDSSVEAFSDDDDKHLLLVDLRFQVRTDERPTAAAELQHAAVHAAVVGDDVLLDLCDSVRLQSTAFDRDEADQTAVVKTATYRFAYLIPENTL